MDFTTYQGLSIFGDNCRLYRLSDSSDVTILTCHRKMSALDDEAKIHFNGLFDTHCSSAFIMGSQSGARAALMNDEMQITTNPQKMVAPPKSVPLDILYYCNVRNAGTACVLIVK